MGGIRKCWNHFATFPYVPPNPTPQKTNKGEKLKFGRESNVTIGSEVNAVYSE